ncbi:MAG: hypothetical protein EBZ47_05745 [Chlamydiae bacterium]|nr:hypothetical protein [Chlamydiota bacterium]
MTIVPPSSCLKTATFHLASSLDSYMFPIRPENQTPADKQFQSFILNPLAFSTSALICVAEATCSLALATLSGLAYVLTACHFETLRKISVSSTAYTLLSINQTRYIFARCFLAEGKKSLHQRTGTSLQLSNFSDEISTFLLRHLLGKEVHRRDFEIDEDDNESIIDEDDNESIIDPQSMTFEYASSFNNQWTYGNRASDWSQR